MPGTTSAEKKKVFTVTDPKVDAAVREKLITARIALLLKAPFFGNLATRLQLENADAWCPTLATDGRKFYYNSEFVNKLPQRQIEFGFGHEVLHIVYDHMGRNGDRNHQIFNIAADYCVNADLIEQHIGDKITVVPILYDAKYKGWSAEEVYDDLLKNSKQISIAELMDMLLDEHLDGNESQVGDENQDSGRPKMSAEERKTLRDEIREAVLQAAEAAGAGNLPSGVKRMINSFTDPQMNWRELIQQQIQSLVKNDFTWMRPSRRSWHMDAIMPGSNFAQTIDISVAIDASGSMSNDMLRDILSEVKGIMQTFDDFSLKLWSYDTKVYGFQQFSPDNIDEIDTYEVKGGGGTDFACNYTFMKDNDIAPKLFLNFTDGYPCDSWGDPDYTDTLFVIHGSTSIVPPFGQFAYYALTKKSS